MSATKSHTAEFVRNESWETITYTREQFAATVEEIEDDAVRDAAKRLWESVKGEMEQRWDKARELRSHGAGHNELLARQTDKEMLSRLDAFKVAFDAMGCALEVTCDWTDGSIFQVSLYNGSVMGCIRNYAG